MKNRITLLMLLVVFSACLTKLHAQKNLNAWIQKCQGIPSIDVSVITDKDPETKKISRKMIVVTFTNNPSLRQELLDAFNKDKDDAYRVAEKSQNGQVIPDYCRFLNTKTKEETRYMFTFKGDKVEATMRVSQGEGLTGFNQLNTPNLIEYADGALAGFSFNYDSNYKEQIEDFRNLEQELKTLK